MVGVKKWSVKWEFKVVEGKIMWYGVFLVRRFGFFFIEVELDNETVILALKKGEVLYSDLVVIVKDIFYV